MSNIMIEFYLIKRNFIISILFLIQHNCILSRLPTSEARRGTAEQKYKREVNERSE